MFQSLPRLESPTRTAGVHRALPLRPVASLPQMQEPQLSNGEARLQQNFARWLQIVGHSTRHVPRPPPPASEPLQRHSGLYKFLTDFFKACPSITTMDLHGVILTESEGWNRFFSTAKMADCKGPFGIFGEERAAVRLRTRLINVAIEYGEDFMAPLDVCAWPYPPGAIGVVLREPWEDCSRITQVVWWLVRPTAGQELRKAQRRK